MSKETILILDKDFQSKRMLKTLLEKENYIALAVDGIDQVLRNFREFEVSGLITEYQIDHIHLPEKIRDLKKSFPELYVMMVAHQKLEEKEYEKVMSAGINDIFQKPISRQNFLIHLKKGLRQRKMLLQTKRSEQ